MHVMLDAHTLDVLFFDNVAQTSGFKKPDQADSGVISSKQRNKYGQHYKGMGRYLTIRFSIPISWHINFK